MKSISLPVRLLICVTLGLLVGQSLSPQVIAAIYTLSAVIKDALMLVLPFIIWIYLTSAILAFQDKALWMILAIAALIILFNATALWFVYGVGTTLLPIFITPHPLQLDTTQTVEALWALPIRPFIKPEVAMLLAVACGIVGCTFKKLPMRPIVAKGRAWAQVFLNRFFIPVLPLYVLGFVLKLDYEGSLTMLVNQCGQMLVLSWSSLLVYVLLMYLVAAKFSTRRTLQYLSNMLPAGVAGFSTMSSAASMPLTLEATEKNLKEDPDYAGFVIPATVNAHMTGDNINISLTALTLLWMTQQPMPALTSYIIFTGAYCLTKFSAVGVPGGGMLVILPVLQTYLHLDQETTALLATLYIIQDGLLTGANIMGNGAFAIISHRILGKLLNRKNNKEFAPLTHSSQPSIDPTI